MKVQLIDLASNGVVQELNIPALVIEPRSCSFSVPGGSLLVSVRAEHGPSQVALRSNSCTLAFSSVEQATQFAACLLEANSKAVELDQKMLD